MNTSEVTRLGIPVPPGTERLFDPAAFRNALHDTRLDAWGDFDEHCLTISPDERLDLLCDAIRLCGRDELDQDTRDLGSLIANKVLESAYAERDAGLLNKSRIIDTYCETVMELKDSQDRLGAPLSLCELGSVLAGGLGHAETFDEHVELRGRVLGAWANYSHVVNNGASDDDWKPDPVAVSNNFVPYAAAEAQQNPHWEWAREQPVMNESQQIMHDKVLGVIEAEGSFKQFMAENSKQFQLKAAESGVEALRYWNLTDPKNATQIIHNLPEHRAEEFNQELKKFGVTLEDCLNNELLTQTMSDEVHLSISQLIEKDASRLVDPAQTLERIARQVELAETANKPAKVVKPLRKLLVSYGLIEESASWREVIEQLKDATTLESLRGIFETTYAESLDELAKLRALQGSVYKTIQMGFRDKADVYSGDLTRDCTAYHLANGFNAWTLPYWLANPGFNLIYSVDQGQAIAKFGTLLATDSNGQARVVIDSIETSKYIADPNRALEVIQRSFQEIQDWAESLGMGEVLVCTFTNSSELAKNLPITNNPSPLTTLNALHGLQGLTEVQRALDETCVSPKGYYQSELADEDHQDNEEEAITHLNRLEQLIVKASDSVKDPKRKEKFFAIARAGSWDRFIKAFVIVAAPRLKHTFDIDPLKLEDFYKKCQQAKFTQIKKSNMVFDTERAFAMALEIACLKESELLGAEARAIELLETRSYGTEDYDDPDFDEQVIEEQFYINFEDGSDIKDYLGHVKSHKYLRSAKGLDLLLSEFKLLDEFLQTMHTLHSNTEISNEDVLRRIFGQQAAEVQNDEPYVAHGQLRLRHNLQIIDKSMLEQFFGRL